MAIVGLSSTRRRVIPHAGVASGIYTGRTVNTYPVLTDVSVTDKFDGISLFLPLRGTQVTVSENHPSWRNRKNGSFKGDIGGPFSSTKTASLSSDSKTVLTGSRKMSSYRTDYGNYVGPFLPMQPSSFAYPPALASSQHDLDKQGTVAISRVAPTNPAANFSQFLIELIKDGIPHLIGSGLKGLAQMSNKQRRKAIAGEHLNYEFGWKPLVNDLKAISQAIIHADTILRQYERDSQRVVRRKYDFPPVVSESFEVVKTNCSPWVGPSGGILLDNDPTKINKGYVMRQLKTVKYQWFSGAFWYYFPTWEADPITRFVAQARHMQGLSLTPDVIWAVAPWSWAVDWFVDVHEVLNNFTAQSIDSQVLLYGYMMETIVSTYTYRFVGPTGFQTSAARPPDVVMTSTVKTRRKATPFGFGLDPFSFTARQKAIVSSLAVSRQKGR